MASLPLLVGPRIWEELDSYDKNLKSKFIRAFRFLSKDIGHPSLQIGLVRGAAKPFYRAPVDPRYRFHFERMETHYLILGIGPHRLQGVG